MDKALCNRFNIIFKSIYNGDMEAFAEDFRREKEINSVKIKLKRWLNCKKPIVPKSFFRDYKYIDFAKKNIFKSAREFSEIEIEEFKKRVELFHKQKSNIDPNRFYNYLYVYNDDIGISFYKIKYKNSDKPHTVDIEVTPPKKNLEPYIGNFIQRDNKLIFTFYNTNDYITAIFNTDLIYSQTKYLVGVGIGIADINEKIPLAKKVLLTKSRVDTNIDNDLYLILNETEIISAEENSYKFRHENKDFTPSHLNKNIQKVHRLNSFFKKVSKNLYGSFYEQLFFKEFNAINNIFQKLKRKQSYYTHYRKRVLETILDSYDNDEYDKLYISIPINRYKNIFGQQSKKSISFQNKIYQISKKIDIEIIFVLENCHEKFTLEFKQFLSKVNSSIRIYFIDIKKVENEVNSVDFVFTNKGNFVVSKILRSDRNIFNLLVDKTIIDEHEAIYRKIKNRAISYSKYVTKHLSLCCENENPILEKLIGEWHYYSYGSYITQNKNIKFWHNNIFIRSDKVVEYYREEKKIAYGELIIKKNKSVIFLTKTATRRNFIVSFDNHLHQLERAFVVKVISKQLSKEFDIFLIGVMSREPIPIDEIKKILGDIDKVRLLEDNDIKNRLVSYILNRDINRM